MGAVGRVQQGLGAGGDVPAVEEEPADGGTELSASRLPGQDVLDPGLLQDSLQEADLSGLAHAVAPFHGDEQAGPGAGGQVRDLSGRPRLGAGPGAGGQVWRGGHEPASGVEGVGSPKKVRK